MIIGPIYLLFHATQPVPPQLPETELAARRAAIQKLAMHAPGVVPRPEVVAPPAAPDPAHSPPAGPQPPVEPTPAGPIDAPLAGSLMDQQALIEQDVLELVRRVTHGLSPYMRRFLAMTHRVCCCDWAELMVDPRKA